MLTFVQPLFKIGTKVIYYGFVLFIMFVYSYFMIYRQVDFWLVLLYDIAWILIE